MTAREAWNSRPGRTSSWIRRVKRLSLYLRDGFACCYCGRDLRTAEPHEVGLDHLTPQCKGGSNDARNLVTTCRSCNSSRKDRPWREFATGGAIERIERQRRRVLNMALARAIESGEAPWPGA